MAKQVPSIHGIGNYTMYTNYYETTFILLGMCGVIRRSVYKQN